jgi:hypothetical protein
MDREQFILEADRAAERVSIVFARLQANLSKYAGRSGCVATSADVAALAGLVFLHLTRNETKLPAASADEATQTRKEDGT